MSAAAAFAALTWLDLLALAATLLAWFAIQRVIETPPAGWQSVSTLMAELRRRWLQEMARRENRIFDSQIVGNLRQGTTFFASTSILAIGAILTLLGNAELLRTATEGLLGDERPLVVTQIKLLLPTFFLVEAFLRFAWANRIFGYASVAMAAVPEPGAPDAARVARQSAELNIRAAVNFNRGLRAIYFALASLAWLAGALALLAAAAGATGTLWRREFGSTPHTILMQMDRDS